MPYDKAYPEPDKLKGKIVIICGATASGKSKYALGLLEQRQRVVINADSMQVYKELPILTAQPTLADQNACPHKLYGIISVAESFSVAQWLDLALSEIEYAKAHDQVPIVVGGTGMYISALINGLAEVPSIPYVIQAEYLKRLEQLDVVALHDEVRRCDPIVAARIKVGDRQRAIRALLVFYGTGVPLATWQAQTKPYYSREQFFIIHVAPSREFIYQQCDQRFINMLDEGAIEEVEVMSKRLPGARYPKVLGLPEILASLSGQMSWEEMIQKAQQHTRNYAKRQLTWLRNQLQYDWVIH